MYHHTLDVWPLPREQKPMFINEPWLVDDYLYKWGERTREPEKSEDNIRVYVPIDLNREAILRRLKTVIDHYGEANERNESNFSSDVNMLIDQIGIYDQIWFVRTMKESCAVSTRKHSIKGIELVREFIALLEEIPDGCAELFPFETIDELKKEFEC